MGWRLRRSIKLGKGVRLNLSKGGVGVSIGGRGFRVGVGPRGIYTSAGIPGTGLYSINYLGKQSKSASNPSSPATSTGRVIQESPGIEMPPELNPSTASTTIGCLWFIASLILLSVAWRLGLLGFILGIVWAGVSAGSPLNKARSHFNQGKAALQKGDYGKALEAFSKVLEFKPDVISLYPHVALLHLQLGNYQEAAKAFEKYLVARPDDYMAKITYANTLGLLEEYDKVIEVLQKLPTEIKQELIVINLLASAFLELNKPELAREVLEKGPVNKRKMENEDMMLFRYLLGVTYKKLGEFKKAIQQLNKVYVEDAGYADVKELLEELNTFQTNGS